MNPKIRFRAVEPDDADLLFLTENDEDSWGDSDVLAPLSRRMLRDYAEDYMADPLHEGQLRLMAKDASTGRPVGILDFYEIEILHRRAFTAIYVFPEFRGKGYGRAMLEEGARYAERRLGLERIAARILSVNNPSIQLFEKAGYRHCGTLPSWHFADGRPHDVLLYLRSL